MTSHDAFILASGKGYKVAYDPSWPGYVITTPARPRHPSQQLGAYRDERSAWMDAAALAQEHN
ncbi:MULTISPECIES: hypothetical protein [unclassified Bradyrhizobium]|uniref:hypothetical protein n=1 Tax=unclassified Bradyrhizobium TaxID=2631580 RepID=UPI002916F9C3|nr:MULTISPECIES: hypothetical protein [unclassified Bradyrhizobium]